MTKDRLVYRHRIWVRITHWINVVCMTILLMSGLQIFNAHPALYWGNASYFADPLVAISGFPAWATLGDGLALARDWHFLMAWAFVLNGVIYLLFGAFSGHFRRDPGRDPGRGPRDADRRMSGAFGPAGAQRQGGGGGP